MYGGRHYMRFIFESLKLHLCLFCFAIIHIQATDAQCNRTTPHRAKLHLHAPTPKPSSLTTSSPCQQIKLVISIAVDIHLNTSFL